MSKKVRPGQPLRIHAETFNTMIDAAEAFKNNAMNLSIPGDGGQAGFVDLDIVNQTGRDLEQFEPVWINNADITPEENEHQFDTRPLMTATEGTDLSAPGCIGIVTTPLPSGRLGKARISGFIVGDVTFGENDANRFANFDSTGQFLVSAPSGPVQIIWRDTTSSGQQRCLLKLGYPTFRVNPDAEPDDGAAGIGSPDAQDVTGEAANPDHLYIKGDLYETEDPTTGQRKWATWFVFNPWFWLPSRGWKVKTNADDTTEGYLNDEILAGPAAGHAWISKAVTPAGAADNKLRLTHADWDGAGASLVGDLNGNVQAGNGVMVLTSAPADEPYISFSVYKDKVDAKKHSTIVDSGTKKYVKLPADEKVKTDASDTTAGYLNDEILVGPDSGDGYLIKAVTPGGAANNKLRLTHKKTADHSPMLVNADTQLTRIDDYGGGVNLGPDATGFNYMTILPLLWKFDDAGHYHEDENGNEFTIRWLALPSGGNSGDICRFNGTYWENLTPTEVTVVTDFRYDTTSHKLQKKTRTIKVIEAGTESGWTDVHTAEAH